MLASSHHSEEQGATLILNQTFKEGLRLLLPVEIIKKKRDGEALTEDEIKAFIKDYAQGIIPDYQTAALLMAIYWRGMNDQETLALTHAMIHSGETADLSQIKTFKVDKHSTGGIGDKTSLILAPIVAAAGLTVPMISGRGLGHTGGTLDKLESIPGFDTQLSIRKFALELEKYGVCFIGQTPEICPADKKMYALRDVTSTIESFPLICASIMSKKIAEGIDGLILDIKFGSGAFMKTKSQAESLAKALLKVGELYGKKVGALLTNMNQPLGRYAGNALEVLECDEILQGKESFGLHNYDRYADTRELSLQLAAHMLHLSGEFGDVQTSYKLATELLKSGAAFRKWREVVISQGGDIDRLPKPENRLDLFATKSGYVKSIDTTLIGNVGIRIGAGRKVTTDHIEPTAGIEFHAKVGDFVEVGHPLFTLWGAKLEILKQGSTYLADCVDFSEEPVAREELIWKQL